MGRKLHRRALNVWANGQLVGQWRMSVNHQAEFQYDDAWLLAPEGRPLSLSMPFTLDNAPIKGDVVTAFFDNLLPDSEPIRQRLQSRFHTQSQRAFDLLQAIGRDCVGAIQLLSPDAIPEDVFSIQVDPLDEEGVERVLRSAVSPGLAAWGGDDDDLRISIAGAQEKTALTWHDGCWCRPLGSTPTTHIFKLPLGLVGHRQADMRTSVENEWLCAEILRTYGLPIAACEIAQFGGQKALIVERFDRRLASNGQYWLRLPQEDFCQATGTPAASKYEADGGPGLLDMARVLVGSEARVADMETIMLAELLFWMLAATDGHAKNFSLFMLPGGRYRLTPLYDVLSAWPIIGTGPNQMDWQKLKLAMSVRGKNVHYRMAEIQRRHFNSMAARCGLGVNMEYLIEVVIEKTPVVIDHVASRLPIGFPEDVFTAVSDGLRRSVEML